MIQQISLWDKGNAICCQGSRGPVPPFYTLAYCMGTESRVHTLFIELHWKAVTTSASILALSSFETYQINSCFNFCFASFSILFHHALKSFCARYLPGRAGGCTSDGIQRAAAFFLFCQF